MSVLLLAGAAALVMETGSSGTASDAVAVAVAARDLSSGTVLEPDDIDVADVPAGSRLAGSSLAPQAAVGRSTVGDMRAGEMITATRLLSADDAAAGFASMPVTFADPELSAFLVPGMTLDVMWTPSDFTGEPPRIVAEGARVLRVGPDGAGISSTGSISVLLQVADADTVGLAAAMSSGSLSVVVRSP